MGSNAIDLKGSMVALVTPMLAGKSEGAIDWQALEQLIEFHISQGTSAIVTVGTTGESPTVDFNEHIQIMEQTIKWVNGKIPVIAGTGANSTQEAIYLSQEAKKLGADACLSVCPYYNKPTQQGLVKHFSKIADESGIDQILYNVPSRTVVDMTDDTIVELSHHERIIGVKETTAQIDRVGNISKQAPKDFIILSGDDATAVELMIAGGHGNISVTANVAPKAMAELCKLATSNDPNQQQKARELNNQLMPLHNAMFTEANPIPVKWALHLMGMIDKGIRLPLTELSEPYRDNLNHIIEQLKADNIIHVL